MQKVAFTPLSRRIFSRAGVFTGSGPSSKVSATSVPDVRVRDSAGPWPVPAGRAAEPSGSFDVVGDPLGAGEFDADGEAGTDASADGDAEAGGAVDCDAGTEAGVPAVTPGWAVTRGLSPSQATMPKNTMMAAAASAILRR
ncbi:hypothetical protein GCM10010170_018860 [Dactylosporangium salmoneum]|uniref:Uncharacterized protein n=1 Tax=Dactylosporangium salmoneum TaxID=53361 RepID=A0ABN3FU43_9ACTN